MNVDQDLLQVFYNDLSPDQFEHLIADLWTLQGWETQVTTQSSDKGIDVVATQDFPFEQKILIQAKKYGPNTRVSSPEVQKYASLKQRDSVDSVIIITTNEFTKEAKSISKEFNLKFINGKQLLRFIHRLEAEQLVRDYASNNEPSPTVERPSYPDEKPDNQQTGESRVKDSSEPVSVAAEGVNMSMKAVGLSYGRSIDHYLSKDALEVEEQMSRTGKNTFENRVAVFLEVTNMGDKVDVRSKYFCFETKDGYQYSVASDSVVGITGANLRDRWKSARLDISHGQTQYWTIISEPIPANIELERLIYSHVDEKLEIEFGQKRDQLQDQNALIFSS